MDKPFLNGYHMFCRLVGHYCSCPEGPFITGNFNVKKYLPQPHESSLNDPIQSANDSKGRRSECSTLWNVNKGGKVCVGIRSLQQHIQRSDRFVSAKTIQIKDNKTRHLLATFVHVIEQVRREQAL